MAKDFLGKELEVGDHVVFVQLGYRNLMKGKVLKLTPKMVYVKHKETNTGSTITKQSHEQLVKIEKSLKFFLDK